MSSNIYLQFQDPVTLSDWLEFCKKHGIEYRPNVVGGNAFYRGDVQISFGKPHNEMPSPRPNGRIDFSSIQPYDEASAITIGTYFMGDLESVWNMAVKIAGSFGGQMQCDPEYDSLAEQLAQKQPLADWVRSTKRQY